MSRPDHARAYWKGAVLRIERSINGAGRVRSRAADEAGRLSRRDLLLVGDLDVGVEFGHAVQHLGGQRLIVVAPQRFRVVLAR